MKTMMTVVAGAALAACATTPVPADRLARSQAVVTSAEEMNAAADPRAASHLKLAKEQLAVAKNLMQDGDNKAASLTLMRAEADGQAALGLARERSARLEAQQTVESIQQAMRQMQMQMQMEQGGSGS